MNLRLTVDPSPPLPLPFLPSFFNNQAVPITIGSPMPFGFRRFSPPRDLPGLLC